MNRRIRLCIVWVTFMLLAMWMPSLIALGAANVGNLYIARGIVSDRTSVGHWVQARPWLDWAARRLGTTHSERLERRIERADAFVARYRDDGRSGLNATSPVQPYAPEYPVNQSIEQWVLLGYDLDERSLELENQIDLWLYWRTPDGEVITRRVQTDNLVLDGGFEQTTDVGGDMPRGFVKERYSRYTPPFAHRRIVVKMRKGLPTLCAQLDNRQGSVPSGYVSHEFASDGHAYYLVGCWVLGAQDGVKVGLLNLGSGIPDERRNIYVPPAITVSGWTYYSGILALPPNTTSLRAQLLNMGTGVCCFDNVLVVPLGPPTND